MWWHPHDDVDVDDDDDDDDDDVITHHSNGVGLQQLRRWQNGEVRNVSEDIDDSDERHWDPDGTRQVSDNNNNNNNNKYK